MRLPQVCNNVAASQHQSILPQPRAKTIAICYAQSDLTFRYRPAFPSAYLGYNRSSSETRLASEKLRSAAGELDRKEAMVMRSPLVYFNVPHVSVGMWTLERMGSNPALPQARLATTV